VLKYFNDPWDSVPFVVIDVETTGKRPGYDRACQVGFVRFERGKEVGYACFEVNPGIPIPAEATAIHGITDAMVANAPTMTEIFAHPTVIKLIADAQPCGFNSPFDRQFVPPFLEEWSWAWFDGLSVIRAIDRYAKGPGRHRLAACCERHGIELTNAHSAGADARATGQLWVKTAPRVFGRASLGDALHKQGQIEVAERHRFLTWLSKRPPREAQP